MSITYARRGNQLIVLRDSLQDYELFRLIDIEYRQDGYGYKRLFGKDYIIVAGPHDSIFINTEGDDFSMYLPGVRTYKSTVFEKITSNSYLKETSPSGRVEEYKPENMMYVMDYGPLGDPSLFYHLGLPWVEGDTGSGIGVEITIHFWDQRPRDHVLILNGYVDFGKRHLYKANNRVKLFKIKSDDDGIPFGFTWNLEDVVKIQEIKFPRRTKRVKLEIVEVYKGSRWDDTCIRGFLLKDINWEPEHFLQRKWPQRFLDYIKQADENLDEDLKIYKRYRAP